MKIQRPLTLLILSLVLCSCATITGPVGNIGYKQPAAPQVKPAAVSRGFKATLYAGGKRSQLYVSRMLGRYRLEREGVVCLGDLDDLESSNEYTLVSPATSSYGDYSNSTYDQLRNVRISDRTPADERRLQVMGSLRGQSHSISRIKLILSDPCEVFRDQVGLHPACEVKHLKGKTRFTHKATMLSRAPFGSPKEELTRFSINEYNSELGIILNSDSNIAAGRWELTDVSAKEFSPALFEVPYGYQNSLDQEGSEETQ